MERRNIPILMMLAAGAITCIFTWIQGYSMIKKLIALFIVLVIFYSIGTVIKWALDSFDRENAAAEQKEEEILEEEEEE